MTSTSALLAQLTANSHSEPGPLDTSCLVWDGARHRQGYGWIGKDLVHRAAWIARHGPVPDETPWVLHHCDNPPCFADGHIYLGTRADNIADMVQRDRRKGINQHVNKTHCKHGHPFDAANTAYDRGKFRACLTCRREHNARKTAERSAQRREARALAGGRRFYRTPSSGVGGAPCQP